MCFLKMKKNESLERDWFIKPLNKKVIKKTKFINSLCFQELVL